MGFNCRNDKVLISCSRVVVIVFDLTFISPCFIFTLLYSVVVIVIAECFVSFFFAQEGKNVHSVSECYR